MGVRGCGKGEGPTVWEDCEQVLTLVLVVFAVLVPRCVCARTHTEVVAEGLGTETQQSERLQGEGKRGSSCCKGT